MNNRVQTTHVRGVDNRRYRVSARIRYMPDQGMSRIKDTDEEGCR